MKHLFLITLSLLFVLSLAFAAGSSSYHPNYAVTHSYIVADDGNGDSNVDCSGNSNTDGGWSGDNGSGSSTDGGWSGDNGSGGSTDGGWSGDGSSGDGNNDGSGQAPCHALAHN